MHQRLSLLVLITLSASCNSAHSKGNAAEESNSANGAPAATTNTVAAPATVSGPKSLYVDSAAQLPSCTTAIEDELVYTADDQTFHTCQSQAWVTVTIKGKDGADGSNGQAGKDGVDGKSTVTSWTDSFTGTVWFLGGAQIVTPVCPTGYRLPTSQEIQTAKVDGLDTVIRELGLYTDYWYQNPPAAYQATNGQASAAYCLKS